MNKSVILFFTSSEFSIELHLPTVKLALHKQFNDKPTNVIAPIASLHPSTWSKKMQTKTTHTTYDLQIEVL